MKKILIPIIASILTNLAASADWTFIGTTGNGARWYSTDTTLLTDGTIRTFLKGEGRNLNVPPFAILIDCKGKRVRDYVAGEFGTVFFKPWQPATPETAGEISIKALCKNN